MFRRPRFQAELYHRKFSFSFTSSVGAANGQTPLVVSDSLTALCSNATFGSYLQQFADLFHYFKVNCVVAKFIHTGNMADIASEAKSGLIRAWPVLMYNRNPTLDTETKLDTTNELRQAPGTHIIEKWTSRPVSIKFWPKVIYNVNSAGANLAAWMPFRKMPYMQCNSGGTRNATPWYCGVWAMENASADTAVAYRIIYTYYFSFRGVKQLLNT